jgi:hypothetical protein
MNRSRWAVFAVAAALFQFSQAMAAQQAVYTPFGEKIVHTRLAPVLLHRAVPPFAGKHVYQGRLR